MKSVLSIVMVLGLSTLLIVALDCEHVAPTETTAYFRQYGPGETGALNLVTSIYLGYRAFDTLGETIVLLLSIAGVIFLLEKRHA